MAPERERERRERREREGGERKRRERGKEVKRQEMGSKRKEDKQLMQRNALAKQFLAIGVDISAAQLHKTRCGVKGEGGMGGFNIYI